MESLNPNEQVLIAEDDPNDAYFIKLAFAEAGITRPPHISENGLDAIDYLEGNGQYGDRQRFPYPLWILTDLKMPLVDGFQVLAWLNKHPDLQIIPTVVFSSSANLADVKRAYCLGANAYFRKPSGLAGFNAIICGLVQFWVKCERCSPDEPLPDCEKLSKEIALPVAS